MKTVLKGAPWGAVTWLVYGVVETILATGLQLYRFRDMEILGWQWRLVAVLFATYAIAGVVAGCVGALLLALLKRHDEPHSHLSAALTLVAAFGANLLAAWPLARSEQIVLAVAVLLAAGFLLALVSGEWAKRVNFLAGPWTVSLLLLGVPWLSREVLTPEDSSFKKTALSILLLCIVAVVAASVNSWRANRAGAVHTQFMCAAVVFAVFLVAVEIVQRDPSVQAPTPAPGQPKPNVVLIVMDTVRADHLPLYGYARDTAPNLRQFARSATVYSRAIAASDFTMATHATMFTGLYPDWNGAIQSNSPNPIAQPMGDQHATLAEVLRSAGYWTVETAANFAFLSSWTGLTRGFTLSDLRRPVVLSAQDRPFYLREAAKRFLRRIANTGAFDRSTRTAEDINLQAETLLRQAKTSGAPFFLFLNYMDAHTPYVPSDPFASRFSHPAGTPVPPASLHDLKLQVVSGKRKLSPGELDYLTAQYDGGIAEEDAAIAELLQRLRDLELYENSVIVVTSDHGDAFGEHGLLDHFVGFVYQDLVHVPLIVKYPGQREAKQADELVSQVDLMPTILESVGVKAPAPLQGRSLLHPPDDPNQVVFSRGTKSSLIGAGNPRFNGLRRAIFSGSWKLIAWTAGPPELFDLAADPDEQHDLYAAGDPRAADLSKRLESWVAGMPRPHARPLQLDKSSQERLKSLGYVQ